MMKTQRDFDPNLIRSGTRIRESVRSLPQGHFQQIRQMFDKQIYPNKKLSTIYERQSKPLNSQFLLRLPVTDDEKIQRNTNEQTLEEKYRDYLGEYQAFRLKFNHELNQHKTLYPSTDHSQSISLPIENQSYQEISSSSSTSLPLSQLNESILSSKPPPFIMSSTVNYPDSYDASLSTNLNRTGSCRKYVSSLQQTLDVRAKPVVITPITCNVIKRNVTTTITTTTVSDEIDRPVQVSRRLHSSTSMSSTGYDSNSSPSIKSNRNSIATTNSHDFLLESACSSSPSTSSIDEQHLSQSIKPWLQYESNPSIYNDEAFESSTERSSPVITRTHIQLNKSLSIEHRPVIMTRQGNQGDSSTHESLVTKPPINNSSFILQTTTFPEKTDREIRRWNHVQARRIEIPDAPKRPSKYPLNPRASTGFQVFNVNQLPTSINEQKPIDEHEDTPIVAMVENPIYAKLPPKKPPRTFVHKIQHQHQRTDQKVPSTSSSTSNSPTLDLGARSASCMDLTGAVSNVILSKNNRLNVKRDSLKSNDDEPSTAISNRSEPLINNPVIKTKTNHPAKSNMKKGVSEPSLNKQSRSRSPFSPRGILERFKRILPLSSSKQSLNQNDSDDSLNSLSENNEHIRISKLDHVTRVKSIYESIDTTKFFLDRQPRSSINELPNLFNYVVQLLPEQEFGYFSNGNGCITSSNILSQLSQTSSSSSSIIYKYPSNIDEENKLKYFCFPDLYDTNNNPILFTKKTSQEYFRFTLTRMDGTRQYGYCSRFFHKGKLNALCLISPYDVREIYEKILLTATELFIAYKDDDARRFLEEIYSHRLPNRGETIHIDTTTVGLYTLKCEFDRRKESIDAVSLLKLSTETIIKIFSAILYEQKLIFIANELGPLTRLIHTFVCLLYPFTWPHTYVPILPSLMLDVIQAPTPYIIGILRSSESYLSSNDDLKTQDNSDILIVDIDHGRVRSMNDYLNNGIENLLVSQTENSPFQILPKTFKIELKQEISVLRKARLSLSLDECQERLRDVFMSIFVQSCFNYKDFYDQKFQRARFLQSKQHTIELFLEWFTRTQIFELFIRQKFEYQDTYQFAITFDLACEEYMKKLNKQTPQRMTVKSVKRKSATRANKQN